MDAIPQQKADGEFLKGLIAAMLEDVCGDPEIRSRATSLFACAFDGLWWLSGHRGMPFSIEALPDHLNLLAMINLQDVTRHPEMPADVRAPIRGYLESLPGYLPHMGRKQTQAVFNDHYEAETHLAEAIRSMPARSRNIFEKACNELRQGEPLFVSKSFYPSDTSLKSISDLLNEGVSPQDAPEASEPVDAEDIPDDIMAVAASLHYMRGGPTGMDIARAILAERKTLQDEIERLRKAADYISPYLRYTIGDESPGYHPTMPSAVAAFHHAFDIGTQEKRFARARKQVAEIIAAQKAAR
jgi:hypothetical protein